MQDILFNKKLLPDFHEYIEKVSYLDACKVHFRNGGWIICRFSGTEPLVRKFCERESIEKADAMIQIMRDFLGL
jgi:phosphomannomutase